MEAWLWRLGWACQGQLTFAQFQVKEIGVYGTSRELWEPW